MELVRECVVVDINSEEVLRWYAELDHHTESRGRRMGKNDLWIAATAAATNGWVVTEDRDFENVKDRVRVRLVSG